MFLAPYCDVPYVLKLSSLKKIVLFFVFCFLFVRFLFVFCCCFVCLFVLFCFCFVFLLFFLLFFLVFVFALFLFLFVCLFFLSSFLFFKFLKFLCLFLFISLITLLYSVHTCMSWIMFTFYIVTLFISLQIQYINVLIKSKSKEVFNVEKPIKNMYS